MNEDKKARFCLYSRARALPGYALFSRLCLAATALAEAEPPTPCVPRQSLGTRRQRWVMNAKPHFSLLIHYSAFRIHRSKDGPQPFSHPHCFHGFFHIVDPDEVRAINNGDGGAGQRAK